LPAIALGVLLKFFSGKKKRIYLGDVLLGFGLVFYGLSTMKAGFAPLKNNPSFISFFGRFSAESIGGILLCILTGTLMTMILQSSSATVGIAMALASQGLLNFNASTALILGDNIGTTITAELASIGATINAHRTARAHTLFNVIGVIIVIFFFPLFCKTVVWVTSLLGSSGNPDLLVEGKHTNIARHIANAHTLFNVINAIIFLSMLPYLIKLASWLTHHNKIEDDSDEIRHIRYPDNRYIETPAMALGEIRKEILVMGNMVRVMYDQVIESMEERRLKELMKWRRKEESLDGFRREVTESLLRVTQGAISPEDSKEMRSLLRMANNLERIGDSIDNIAKWIEDFIEGGLFLSKEGMSDYREISKKVRAFLALALGTMDNHEHEAMAEAMDLESRINRMEEEMKECHLLRLQKGTCQLEPGLIFVNILTAFERIGGYCFNLCQAAAGIK
ncbi:MAG: Na/Pi cotransporter family protein, partial [Deltaproteobacteria bacterium]|nr:Na/Pi cotransporter family protein [Deltaproteobacteria bacterium]